MGPRVALAAIPALCVVPVVYAAQRLYEVGFTPQVDPAVAPPSPSIALFWRAAVAVAVALGVLGPLFRVAERSPTAALRLGEGALVVAAAVLALQSAVAP